MNLQARLDLLALRHPQNGAILAHTLQAAVFAVRQSAAACLWLGKRRKCQ